MCPGQIEKRAKLVKVTRHKAAERRGEGSIFQHNSEVSYVTIFNIFLIF